jgi:transposase
LGTRKKHTKRQYPPKKTVEKERVAAHTAICGADVREVTTDFGATKPATPQSTDSERPNRSPTASACEPCRELIELALLRGRNAMAIWQDLVSQHGFASGYQSVKRFVRRLRGAQSPEAHPVIVAEPGQEAQVGYGAGPMVRDHQSGKYRRTRLFVMTLGYSRKSARLLVFRSNSRTWAELHEKAFRRLGGAVRVVVLDNLGRACRSPTFTIPRSIPSTAKCSLTTAPSPCRAESKIRIEKEKWKQESVTPRELR